MASDTDILNELRLNSNNTFTRLYESCYPSIAAYIKANQGSEQDAEDIFQETVIVLLNKIKQPGFELTSSLKTYLFAISQNLWLKQLRNRKPAIASSLEHIDLEDIKEVNDVEAQAQKARSILAMITVQCRRILQAIFFAGEPMDKLMMRMGWKNKHTAANQKYKCLEQAKRKNA